MELFYNSVMIFGWLRYKKDHYKKFFLNPKWLTKILILPQNYQTHSK